MKGAATLEVRLWETLEAGDPVAARGLIREQLERGVPGTALILDLLAPAQRAVGLQWQRDRWTVADEHAATAVVDAALSLIEAAIPAHSDGPLLAATCAESEWHSLPARMAVQLLREAGAQVRFLGPSMPADHLREYLARLQPEALILSATMPTSLPGAARTIDAAHDAGVPVIAGGAAFGGDAARAERLGADGWLLDLRNADPLAAVRRDLSSGAAPDWPQYLALESALPAVAAAAYEVLLDRVPALRQMNASQMARTREDLAHILSFLGVSLLVDDPRVLLEFTDWLHQVLAARGVSPGAVTASYRALADQLDVATGDRLRTIADGEVAA